MNVRRSELWQNATPCQQRVQGHSTMPKSRKDTSSIKNSGQFQNQESRSRSGTSFYDQMLWIDEIDPSLFESKFEIQQFITFGTPRQWNCCCSRWTPSFRCSTLGFQWCKDRHLRKSGVLDRIFRFCAGSWTQLKHSSPCSNENIVVFNVFRSASSSSNDNRQPRKKRCFERACQNIVTGTNITICGVQTRRQICNVWNLVNSKNDSLGCCCMKKHVVFTSS